jgi:hypothetical protein
MTSENTRRLALCGVLAALAAAVLLLGGLIPAATYCCPVLASLTLVPSLAQCGKKWALTQWAASAILGLLLCPDREAAFLFLALGYYPIIKPQLDCLRPVPRVLCKLLVFNAAVCAVYAFLLLVLQLDALRQEYAQTGKWLLLALIAGGNVVFFLYDFVLKRLSPRLSGLFQKRR